MKAEDGRILLSASDLMRFVECAHASRLDLDRARGVGPEPSEAGEDAELLRAQGDAHEARHLEGLRAARPGIVEIDRASSLDVAVARTREALAAGVPAVFQGALRGGAWGGWSDFLERVEVPSALGAFSYEVADTKLKRTPDPKHILQLVLYSDLLAEVQGAEPERAHLVLGSGERATLRLGDYRAYARRARRRLEGFVAEPWPTRPVPVAACALCRWREHCGETWERGDSLFLVAGITRNQVRRLEDAGVATMAGLAGRATRVPRLADETLAKLRVQARLQSARRDGPPAFELRAPVPGKGFDLMPEPRPGDLFYDIEGDPFVEGGLEYLHGVWARDLGFRAFWAHDRAAEGEALRALLALFAERLEAHPEARIYHYAAYEITALRRLVARHGTGEAMLDRWLRERRFVDLYAVVRGALTASERSYSIKDLEAFYGADRSGGVTTAGGSVVAYERWRETGDDAILREIEDYNRVDCLSTEGLRDWLVSIRPAGAWPAFDGDAAEAEAAEDAEERALRAMLEASGLPEERRQMLFDLARFHDRERKPGWWAIFDGAAKETEELVEDPDCLAGLVATGPSVPVKRSIEREYRFPPQQTKLHEGSTPTLMVEGRPVGVTLSALDRRRRRATVRVGRAKFDDLPDRLDLLPGAPVAADVIAGAVRAMVKDQCGARAHRAVDDLLARRPPRFRTRGPGPVLAGDPVAGTIAAVADLDDSVLPIQGPPGTGKTHVAARAILALVRQGRRCAVSANSHEAIVNVLMGVIDALEVEDPDVTIEVPTIAHKISEEAHRVPDAYADRIRQVMGNADDALSDSQIVGGTAWLFSRQDHAGAFDTLFVDEAGQVSLANLLGMARAARNIVLIGDPRQLPQVIQGAHPHPADLSCLDWLLDGHATVPPERGVFLPVSRRMHPEVCRFVSDQVYEGRLGSHPETARQRVDAPPLPATGAHLVAVAHEGNAQEAPEEVAAVRALVGRLLAGRVTDRDGRERRCLPGDVIVVAPYNAQVNALRVALPDAVRVGTVDKFQGKEAAVCLVSMTASSAEEIPRGLDFLFSLNRINVAVSRAKALSLVLASPRLLEAPCRTVGDMRLVNTLCALREHGLPLAFRDGALVGDAP